MFDIEKMYEDGETTVGIAEKLGLSPETIRVRLKKAGVKLRNAGKTIHKPANLSIIQEELNGMLMSDLSVHIPGGSTNAIASGTLKEEEFARHYKSILEKAGLKCWVKKTMKWNEYSNKEQPGWAVWSERNPSLTIIRTKWYPDGTRRIPDEVELTPKTCMEWYLGDGSLDKKSKCATIATLSETEEEVDLLVKKLNDKNIMCKKMKINSGKNEGRFIIYLKRMEAIKLLDYIGKCPVDCYKYKWNWTFPQGDFNGFPFWTYSKKYKGNKS